MINKNQIKILIAPNSFKECADSIQTASLIERFLSAKLIQKGDFEIEFTTIPISDGGDGFLEVCKKKYDLEALAYYISKPYGNEKFWCLVGYSKIDKRIYIESAKVLGLNLVPAAHRKPMLLSSKGLGELLLKISDEVLSNKISVEEVFIGIGGTATNDLGMGMLAVFGLRFIDRNGKQLPILPKNFNQVEKIEFHVPDLPYRIKTVVDVNNPLLGEKGATAVFAPQKGASPEEVTEMDKGFSHLLKLMSINGDEIDKLNGAGGGLSAAMQLFFNIKEIFSDKFVKEHLGIQKENSNFDYIITGEGKLDFQSSFNKGAMVIVNEFLDSNIPVYFICGIAEGNFDKYGNIKIVELSKFFNSANESIEKFEEGIDLACSIITNDIVQRNTQSKN